MTEEGQSPPKKKFKDYPIGYLHVDFAEVRTEEGLSTAPAKWPSELQPRATRMVAADFLRRMLEKTAL